MIDIDDCTGPLVLRLLAPSIDSREQCDRAAKECLDAIEFFRPQAVVLDLAELERFTPYFVPLILHLLTTSRDSFHLVLAGLSPALGEALDGYRITSKRLSRYASREEATAAYRG